MRRWSVIACDQFTADASYWQTVQDTVGDAPSTLRLMLPEFYLGKCDEGAATREIQQTMHRYLDGGVFRTVPHSLVLVQRTLPGGATRCGIVGALDLEAYDYAPDSVTPIRATEGTVASRLPARVRIRAAAALEMPHIMVFYSDPDDAIFRDALAAANETLYDFDLMSGGGHVRGLRVADMDADALAARLCATGVGTDSVHPMRFAIADGNHSLAAARLCWLEKETVAHARAGSGRSRAHALVELVNLHSPAVTFEPIHRVLFGTDASKWMQTAEAALASADGSGYAISLIAGSERRDILAKGASLGEAIAAMDTFCAAYLAESGGTVDYIHGDDEALELAAGDGCCGILMPRMDKAELFTSVLRSGPFPKKSFSIGLGADKRYYLECRKL
ncbi:MAG: DUF1015 domain-containing protein [Oscillospiraceae bacterium]